MTAERTLIVAETRMDPALAELVYRTCTLSGVACRGWNGIERLDGLAGQAALVIGVLPDGERRIPGELAGLVTEQLPGLPLVLLAQEPLVRPLVSLDGGRVTLLESPLRPALLVSCARTLLAEAAPDLGGWWAAAAAEGPVVDRREYRVGGGWVGVLDCGGVAGWPERALPWLQAITKGSTALSAVLSFADAAGQPRTCDGIDWGDPAATGAGGAGPLAAFEWHTGTDGPQWLFPALSAAAAPGGAAALFSTSRLPTWTVLGQAGAGAPIRLGAAAGDLVVAVAPGPGWLDVVRREAAGGGPALLDALEVELQRAPTTFSCVAVELA
jgi:hypothetical protein